MRLVILILAILLCAPGCDRGTRAEFEHRRPTLQPVVIASAVNPGDLTIIEYRDWFYEYSPQRRLMFKVKGVHTLGVDAHDHIEAYGWREEE